jgi:hypothetical protein
MSVDWMTDAQKIAASSSPAMPALEIMGASIIFMMLCWQIPRLFAAVLGGWPRNRPFRQVHEKTE